MRVQKVIVLISQLALMSCVLPMALGSSAFAGTVVSCNGVAMVGGAQLVCSHLDPKSPPQFCTYSWALATMINATQVVQGSFLLQPGANNTTIYQGSGFAHAMSNPIVLCQGKRKATPPARQ